MICKLCDIADVKMGQSPSGKDLNSDGNGMPFLQGRKTFGRIYPTIDTWTTNPKKIGKKDSILLSLRAPVGDINVADQDICIGRGLCSIEPKKNCLQEYLYYLLLFNSRQLRSKATGTTFEGVNRDDINNLNVEVPDLETQKKIVRILSALDQKIESNNQFLKQLSQISAVIFKDMYDNMRSSKELSLGEICNIKYGKNLPTKCLSEEGFPVYGANGIIGYHSEKMYSRPQVLVSCRGVAGAVHISEPNSFVTNNSLILECEDKFHYFIKEYSLSRKYNDYATGSAQPQITINNIKGNILKVPTNGEELCAFNKICAPLEDRYFQTVKQIKTLGTLRDALLPKLMSGEIDMKRVKRS